MSSRGVDQGKSFGKVKSGSLNIKGVNLKKHNKKKKKDKKQKKDKKEKKRKRQAEMEEGGRPAEEDDEDIPELQVGKGRVISSGTTLSGLEGTNFLETLHVGDAIIVRHPSTFREETRIVKMVLGNSSLAISSPFSTDLISSCEFHFICAPREEPKPEQIAAEKRQRVVDEENQAFGTYAGGGKKGEMITYRVHTKSVWGGYRIVTKKADEDMTREDLLDFRQGQKADRMCM